MAKFFWIGTPCSTNWIKEYFLKKQETQMRDINFEEQNENVTNAVWGDTSPKPGADEVTDMDELNKEESEDSDIEESQDDEDSSIDETDVESDLEDKSNGKE